MYVSLIKMINWVSVMIWYHYSAPCFLGRFNLGWIFKRKTNQNCYMLGFGLLGFSLMGFGWMFSSTSVLFGWLDFGRLSCNPNFRHWLFWSNVLLYISFDRTIGLRSVKLRPELRSVKLRPEFPPSVVPCIIWWRHCELGVERYIVETNVFEADTWY